jgi:uncharacterized membrane protein
MFDRAPSRDGALIILVGTEDGFITTEYLGFPARKTLTFCGNADTMKIKLQKRGGGIIVEIFDTALYYIVEAGILLLEYIGVGIIIWTNIISFYKYVTRKPDTRIYLGKGLAMGLEFKIGSEILRTVIVREWSEIAIVAGIIALRAALTFLIHWEIKEEEKEAEREMEKKEIHAAD